MKQLQMHPGFKKSSLQ